MAKKMSFRQRFVLSKMGAGYLLHGSGQLYVGKPIKPEYKQVRDSTRKALLRRNVIAPHENVYGMNYMINSEGYKALEGDLT